jgi:hypothetical protein
VKSKSLQGTEKENVQSKSPAKQRPVILKRSSSLSDSKKKFRESSSSESESLKSVPEIVKVDEVDLIKSTSPKLQSIISPLEAVSADSDSSGCETSPLRLKEMPKYPIPNLPSPTRSSSLHSSSLPEVISPKEPATRRLKSLNDVDASKTHTTTKAGSPPLDDSLPKMIFVFTFIPSYSAKTVSLTGSFDDWSKSIEMINTEGSWKGHVLLDPRSSYAYKFVVDGIWLIDVEKAVEIDEVGNINNFLAVDSDEGMLSQFLTLF